MKRKANLRESSFVNLLTSVLVSLAAVPCVFVAPAYGLTVSLKDTIFVISEIVVEAQRPSHIEKTDHHPSFVAIVPLGDRSSQVSSAADYLADAVGCHVKSTGGYGAYSSASIRGASSKQVRIFIDGIPLPQSQSGVVDLGNLPINSIERIEVYRGFGPNDLSGSSIGGMINLVTRSAKADNASLSSLYGSHETTRFECSYAKFDKKWDALFAGSLLSTKGNYRFLDDNGTPYNQDDDQWTQRVNNDLCEQDGLLKITASTRWVRILASNQFYHREQGLPGYSSFQSTTQRMKRSYNLTHLALRFPTWKNLLAEIDGYHLYQKDCFEDRRPKTAGVKPDEENYTTSSGGNLRFGIQLPRLRQWMRTTVSISSEKYQPYETFDRRIKGECQTRKTLASNFEDEVALFDGKLNFFPSLRLEHLIDKTQPFETIRKDLVTYNRSLKDTSITRTLMAKSIGMVASLKPGLTIKASVGSYYRLPTLIETFGYRGITLPNPLIRPEKGFNRDIGLVLRSKPSGCHFDFEVAYFWSDVSDLIMYVFVPFAQTSQAINIDSAKIKGVETSFSIKTPFGISLNANLTHLDAINTGPITYMHGKRLPNRPEIESAVEVRLAAHLIEPYYQWRHISGNYWNAANTEAPNRKGALLPVRNIHNIGMTVTPHKSVRISYRINNLTDKQFEDVMGYPLPGRTSWASIEFIIR